MASTATTKKGMLVLDKKRRIEFAVQPILMLSSHYVSGYELLYRGPRTLCWQEVDAIILRYLTEYTVTTRDLYVNITPETIVSLPDQAFIDASRHNRVVFEISEVSPENADLDIIYAKVQRLSNIGIRFALDDFGAGIAGLRRVFTLERYVSIIKIDGSFIEICHESKMARRILKSMVAEWKKNGIVTVAEWISSEALLAFAMDIGFSMAQGWFIDEIVKGTTASDFPPKFLQNGQ